MKADEDSSSDDEWYAAQGIDGGKDNSSPRYSPHVWMISTRPTSTTNKFSKVTLLFQPDTRLFCHRGSSCEISTPQHLELYEHQLPAKITPAPTPENPFSVPNCGRTWTLDKTDPDTSSFEFRTAAAYVEPPPIPENSTVVIFVHGHSTAFFRAIGALTHLDLLAKGRAHCIGFLWPAHFNKLSYPVAREKAMIAGKKLRDCISALQARKNKVVVLAHSLGTRVALAALSVNSGEGAILTEPIEGLFLLAAAVSSTIFGDEFPLSGVCAKHVNNFFSNFDDVLSQGFILGEVASGTISIFNLLKPKEKALGLEGCKTMEGKDEGDTGPCFLDFDLSEDIKLHSFHSYFDHPTLQGKLKELLVSEEEGL
jgi:esterase/lipase superfamily enzyme